MMADMPRRSSMPLHGRSILPPSMPLSLGGYMQVLILPSSFLVEHNVIRTTQLTNVKPAIRGICPGDWDATNV